MLNFDSFFLEKFFLGNFHLTFSKIFKRNFQKHEFIEVKKNDYYEYSRKYIKKCEIMSLSVTAVIPTS